MEVMDASLDKFYQNIYKNGETIPEDVLGKIAFSVSGISISVMSEKIVTLIPEFILMFFFLCSLILKYGSFGHIIFHNGNIRCAP